MHHSEQKCAHFCSEWCSVLFKWNLLTNPTMQLSHITQCTIQNINVYISFLYGAFWDIGLVYCGICEFISVKFIHKSHNAPVPYPTMYHSEQKCMHFFSNGALWDIELVHCGICEFILFQWNLRKLLHSIKWECHLQYFGHCVSGPIRCFGQLD